jgi:hypothetical protein
VGLQTAGQSLQGPLDRVQDTGGAFLHPTCRAGRKHLSLAPTLCRSDLSVHHRVHLRVLQEIRKDRARRQGGPLLLPSFGLSALDPRQWCCCKKKATEHAKLEGEDLP